MKNARHKHTKENDALGIGNCVHKSIRLRKVTIWALLRPKYNSRRIEKVTENKAEEVH